MEGEVTCICKVNKTTAWVGLSTSKLVFVNCSVKN